MFHWEERLIRERKIKLIAGLDEAGRGPLAGPLVVAAVIIKPEYRKKFFSNKIRDSKKLNQKERESAFKEILEKAWIGVGISDTELINSVDISSATFFAAKIALENLRRKPELILTDAGIMVSSSSPFISLIDGERKSISIACASIVAKIIRDRIMEVYDSFFPCYAFKKHKGYGTREHFDLIKRYGPSPIHRENFSPIRGWLER